MKHSILKFDFMYVWFFWEDKPVFKLKSVNLGLKKPVFKESESANPAAAKMKNQIVQYINGTITKLPINRLDMSSLSPFAKKVLYELRNSVRRGEFISYGRLAKLAGNQLAARAVGTVMRNNPFPLFFPCHRVIKSNGELGLFQGSANGRTLKELLLKQEGTF